MAETKRTKVLLIGLDGLRPDMLDAALTPNLWAFAQAGVRFCDNRTVFPSETYPCVASLLTGTPPGAHGIVANEFHLPELDRRRAWLGADIDAVEGANRALRGGLHRRPLIGDLLGDAGMTFWSISTGSPGSARLIHPNADRYHGHLCLIVKALERSRPAGIAAAVTDMVGPPRFAPAKASLDEQSYATNAFLALEKSRGMPDLAVIWYGGIDSGFHAFGLGAEDSLHMVRHVDGEVGRLLDWWRDHDGHDRVQLFILSDHGHVTQTRKVDVRSVLTDAGFRVAAHLEDGGDVALIPGAGWSGNLRVRDGKLDLLTAVCRTLMAHPAMGMLFTRARNEAEGIATGTFAQSLVNIAHPGRSSDLHFALCDSDETDPFGFAGTCWGDNSLEPGTSNHGGFHPKAIQALLLLGGSAFRQGAVISTPSGITDISPTILHLLDLPAARPSAGRVLCEAWSPSMPAGPVENIRWSVGNGDFEQELLADRIGAMLYFRAGRRLAR